MRAGLCTNKKGQLGVGTPDGAICTSRKTSFVLQRSYHRFYTDYYVKKNKEYFFSEADELLIPHELM